MCDKILKVGNSCVWGCEFHLTFNVVLHTKPEPMIFENPLKTMRIRYFLFEKQASNGLLKFIVIQISINIFYSGVELLV